MPAPAGLQAHRRTGSYRPSPTPVPPQHNAPSRLLMPTVRVPYLPAPAHTAGTAPAPAAPRSPRLVPTSGTTPSKLTRARSASASRSLLDLTGITPHVQPQVPAWTSADTGTEWLGLPLRFDVVQECLQVEGYQMYAVEKWYASPISCHKDIPRL